MEVSVVKEYNKDTRRRRTRVVQADDSNEEHTQFQEQDDFKANTFLPILDQLHSVLCETYAHAKKINDKFTTIILLGTLEESELRAWAKILQEFFPEDSEDQTFEDESLHFQIYCCRENIQNDSPVKTLQHIRKHNLGTIFQYVDIAYKLLITTPVTNCSTECSFSCMKRLKNYLCSTSSQDRLNSLMILAIESELLLSLQFDDIIKTFAKKKA